MPRMLGTTGTTTGNAGGVDLDELLPGTSTHASRTLVLHRHSIVGARSSLDGLIHFWPSRRGIPLTAVFERRRPRLPAPAGICFHHVYRRLSGTMDKEAFGFFFFFFSYCVLIPRIRLSSTKKAYQVTGASPRRAGRERPLPARLLINSSMHRFVATSASQSPRDPFPHELTHEPPTEAPTR